MSIESFGREVCFKLRLKPPGQLNGDLHQLAGAPGQALRIDSGSFQVACGQGVHEVLEVQPESPRNGA